VNKSTELIIDAFCPCARTRNVMAEQLSTEHFGKALMAGGSADSVVDRYRQHVAAIAERLSIR
jgi:hypothetical protein